MDHAREKLEQLLAESPEDAERRIQGTFDSVNQGKPIVIFGAGNLGKKAATVLAGAGRTPAAFTDNNAALWGSRIDGVEVCSPAAAAERFGSSATFVICVWHPARTSAMLSISRQLSALGCHSIAPFVWLFWKYPDLSLPYYLWDSPVALLREANAVREALALFEEPASRLQFVNHIALRCSGDFNSIESPVEGKQYFPKDLFSANSDECFVDCGAFDGDTINDFVDWCGPGFRKVIAFEPDPANFAGLRQMVARAPHLAGRIDMYNAAVGSHTGTTRFAANGSGSAAVSDSGSYEVACAVLDDILDSDRPTYIKMDIEGAELDALEGARCVITRCRPLMAVCVYHAQSHLWEIPLHLRGMLPETKLYLRGHESDGLDLVCYAVHRGR